MKKQFVTFITLLGISVTLVGCSSAEPKKPASNTVVETPTHEETSENLQEAGASTETEEVTSNENNDSEEETNTVDEVILEKESDEKTQAQANNKPIEESKPTTPTKPQPSPSAKPEVSPVPSPSPTPVVKPEVTPENKPETPSLSSSEVFAEITSDIELPAQMDVDATLLNDLYGIDASLLESYAVKMPMMSFSISEIGVFKVKDSNNISSIVEGINKRANDVGQMLYPSLQETFDSRVITTKGNYILFAMDESASIIEAHFNNLIK